MSSQYQGGGARMFGGSVALLFLLGSTSQLCAQTFAPLSPLPGGSGTYAFGLSADGSTVVGSGGDASHFEHAIRWALPAGVQDLGILPGGTRSEADAVNGDGSVVVGFADVAPGAYRAFRWRTGQGMTDLGTLPGQPISYALAVNSDGSVVVGISGSPGAYRAFRWTSAAGMQPLGELGSDVVSYANGVSADGSIIVGTSGDGSGGNDRAVIWTDAGVQGLGFMPGGTISRQRPVPSAAMAWPSSEWATRPTACRHSVGRHRKDAALLMALLPEQFDAQGNCATQTGSAVAGTCTTELGIRAFVWRSGTGIIVLDDFLAARGVDLSAWSLNEVRGISGDGRVVAGLGTHNSATEAWVATLPAFCGSADFNCDGDAGTDADIEAFFACLAGSCPPPACSNGADFNADGDVGTDADIESFFRVLAGAPC